MCSGTRTSSCQICGKKVVSLVRHAIEEHPQEVQNSDVPALRTLFGISESTAKAIRKRINGISHFRAVCPRCGKVIDRAKQHLLEDHAVELIVAHDGLGMPFARIKRLLFNNGLCSVEQFRDSAQCIDPSARDYIISTLPEKIYPVLYTGDGQFPRIAKKWDVGRCILCTEDGLAALVAYHCKKNGIDWVSLYDEDQEEI